MYSQISLSTFPSTLRCAIAGIVFLLLPAPLVAVDAATENDVATENAENAAAVASSAEVASEAAEAEADDQRTVFEEILVSAAAPSGPAEREIGRDQITELPFGDAAEVLRNVSGLAIGRMGGHGLEPRIRGLGETNVNVILDGAYVHNACPSRMDPPTSFGAVESFERVVVLKGVQTVRYGGGGSAGTVLYQRETPRFDDDEHWRASVSSSLASHSREPDLTIDAALGMPKLYLRAIGETRDMDSYEDGGGTEVRTAFEKRDLKRVERRPKPPPPRCRDGVSSPYLPA